MNCTADNSTLYKDLVLLVNSRVMHIHTRVMRKFQFQFMSCTSSVLKKEAKRRLQCAALNCAKV